MVEKPANPPIADQPKDLRALLLGCAKSLALGDTARCAFDLGRALALLSQPAPAAEAGEAYRVVEYLLSQLREVKDPNRTVMWESPDGKGGQFADKGVTLLCWLIRATSAALQPQAGEIPKGYCLVPTEITLEMQHAYFEVIDRNMERVQTDARFGRYSNNQMAYRAMLKAAPPPTTGDAGKGEG